MDASLSAALLRALEDEQTVVLATLVAGAGTGRQLLLDASGTPIAGDLGSAALNARAAAVATDFVPTFRCGKIRVAGDGGEWEVFVEVHGPTPQLIIVGAVHVAIPLVHFARLLGFRTVVIDPRPVFAQRDRFAHADQLIVDWPDEAFAQLRLHERTMVAVLSHDLRIDVPALTAALRRRLLYVGALGSRKTQAKRVAALRDAGLAEEDVARIRSPIGFNLGSRRAEDVALAIAAEIVAVTNGVSLDAVAPGATGAP